MAYPPSIRRSALRLVAAQGYGIAAGLTGISETSLRRWAQHAAERELRRVSLPTERQEINRILSALEAFSRGETPPPTIVQGHIDHFGRRR